MKHQKHQTWTRILSSAGLLVAVLGMPVLVQAQDAPQRRPVPSQPGGTRLGLDLFGGAGFSWPAAKDSFDAVDLSSRALDVGGGARVTGLWRTLFVQVAMTQWSDSGERACVADDGTTFPLGIPLELKARFFDATVGVKHPLRTSAGRLSMLTYVGAGAGVVRYEETSPFAEPGDDLDTSEPSYHVLLGIEVPIAGLLAATVDGRYRYIPGLLGDGGASGVLEEDSLGGFQTSVGVRLGFGRPRSFAPPPPRTGPTADAAPQLPPAPSPDRLPGGIIAEAAPVFALPDSTRTPLRTLDAGTIVRIVEQKGEWIRVEFNDRQWGRRIGYVHRKFVQLQEIPE